MIAERENLSTRIRNRLRRRRMSRDAAETVASHLDFLNDRVLSVHRAIERVPGSDPEQAIIDLAIAFDALSDNITTLDRTVRECERSVLGHVVWDRRDEIAIASDHIQRWWPQSPTVSDARLVVDVRKDVRELGGTLGHRGLIDLGERRPAEALRRVRSQVRRTAERVDRLLESLDQSDRPHDG